MLVFERVMDDYEILLLIAMNFIVNGKESAVVNWACVFCTILEYLFDLS